MREAWPLCQDCPEGSALPLEVLGRWACRVGAEARKPGKEGNDTGRWRLGSSVPPPPEWFQVAKPEADPGHLLPRPHEWLAVQGSRAVLAVSHLSQALGG